MVVLLAWAASQLSESRSHGGPCSTVAAVVFGGDHLHSCAQHAWMGEHPLLEMGSLVEGQIG